MSEKLKQIVKDVNAAFERNEPETFLDACTDDVKWTLVGEKTTNGKQEIRDFMAACAGAGMDPPKINVTDIIADGDTVACYGDMTMKDKDGVSTEYGYCDVYRFDGEKIAELNSIFAKLKPEGESSAKAA